MRQDMSNEPVSLLTIPLEIRVKIYQCYFVLRQIPISTAQKLEQQSQSQDSWAVIHQDDWSLILTCKQICSEALPEYYRRSDFHCLRAASAFDKLARIELCRTNLRHVTIEPLTAFPVARDLLHFPALDTVRMYKLRAFEPLGFSGRNPGYHPLGYDTLKQAARQTHQIRWPDPQPVSQMEDLETEYLALWGEMGSNHPRPRFIVNFDYSYTEKIDHPDGWGGMTPKRLVEIQYNQTDDVFIIESEDGSSSGQLIVGPNA